MPPRAATTRQNQPPAVRRAQILEAALHCFAERGYHTTTMDDVVRASGLSKGSLYWHFESKQEVLLALFDRFAEDTFSELERAAAGEGAVLPRLRDTLESLVDRVLSQGPLLPAWMEFLAHPAARQRFADVYRKSRELLAGLLTRGVETGEVRDLPPESMATAFIASAEGLLLQALADPDFDSRAHQAVLWQGLIGGFTA